jgi:3-hexulose-6-phosphate synthase
MLLQLAIDTLELDDAEKLVSTVRDLVDIVEIGTPVVIRDGVAAVRRLRAAFPGLPLVADLKIADGGHFEATLGFEAGASLVTVLATAADATILDALRAAREHGGAVMVDLMGVADLAGRAAEVDRMGARYVCLHTPTDLQSGDADAERRAVDGLQRIRDVLRGAATAVAGGITAASARGIAALRPDLVVVGSGITRATDPRAAAAAIRASLDEGGRS